MSKQNSDFVDGSIHEPTDSSQILLWKRADNLVTGWIHAFVFARLSPTLFFYYISQQIWADLKQRNYQSNGPKIFQLRQ